MNEKLYVIKACDCLIVDNYSNILEVHSSYGCAKARVDYLVQAGVPNESLTINIYELKEPTNE